MDTVHLVIIIYTKITKFPHFIKATDWQLIDKLINTCVQEIKEHRGIKLTVLLSVPDNNSRGYMPVLYSSYSPAVAASR